MTVSDFPPVRSIPPSRSTFECFPDTITKYVTILFQRQARCREVIADTQVKAETVASLVKAWRKMMTDNALGEFPEGLEAALTLISKSSAQGGVS